jgi:hypothetical protein
MRRDVSFAPPSEKSGIVHMVAWGMLPEHMTPAAFQRIRREVKAELRRHALNLEYSDRYYSGGFALKKRKGRKGENWITLQTGSLQTVCRCALTHIDPDNKLRGEVTYAAQ